MSLGPTDSEHVRLFVYGLLLRGEREHSLLDGSEFIGEAWTAPAFTLVDLGVYPALLEGGSARVVGELYRVHKRTRFALDIHQQCPVMFERVEIALSDGSRAETYVMREEQARGKRRLHQGSWRDRFAPRPRTAPPSALVDWARKRFDRE